MLGVVPIIALRVGDADVQFEKQRRAVVQHHVVVDAVVVVGVCISVTIH